MMLKRQKGFTYLEILIVLLVIGTLMTISIGSYTNVRSNSLDQRRKTDLEEIRSALEQYRSVNDAYPTPNSTPGLPFGTSGLTDDTHTYMQHMPQDPQFPKRQYNYTAADDDYTLAVELANPEPTACVSPPGADACGQEASGFNCNYCIGSYGKK